MDKEHNIYVIKRNGNKVPFELAKWQAQIAKVCEGVSDVSPSMIEIAAQAQFFDGMTTKKLDEIALRSMVDLIDEIEHPEVGNVNYQHAAGKQRLMMLRKDVYGTYNPPPLYDIVKKNIQELLYTPDLLEWYSEDEWNAIDKFIEHDKDELLPYAAIEQLCEKYLVQNRVTGKIVETPQVRYAIASAVAFHAEKKNRMKYVKEFYEASSDGAFTLATPVLAGLGTKTKQFSSCVLIKVDDSLKSIFAAGQVMADYASKKAGIGLDVGRIRPLGASIRNGEIKHTGILPFLKKWFGDLRSCCLTPEMYVQVLDNRIMIKDVKIGMKIKSYKDGKISFEEITDKFFTEVPEEEQISLEFENGVIVNCSINHPFMIFDGKNIQEKLPLDLLPEDMICTETGFTKLLVSDLRQANPLQYIDITVKNTNTFFTSNSKEGEMILTHNSAGGLRNAACTVNYPIWHYQFDDLIVLKNNQGTEENRVRHMDYCVALSAFFWRRFKNQENITFFDPNEVPDLYEAFYRDTETFEILYQKYEKRKDLRTKVLPAETVFKDMLLKERTETGRIYLLNIDNVQNHSSYITKIHPIYQTNLCCEILLPTIPFETIDDNGSLYFELNGKEICIPNTATAILNSGEEKLVKFISEEDDVLFFREINGQEFVLPV